MLHDVFRGTEPSNDSPPKAEYNPPSGKLVVRGFNLGLRDMLNEALGTLDDMDKREVEERKQQKGEHRGMGIGDMLEDALLGSG